MATSWQARCSDPRIQIEGDWAVVTFPGGRSHRVQLRETAKSIEIDAMVARARAIKDVNDLPLRVWLRNRKVQLVSFRIAANGDLRASGWVPKAGLPSGELALAVRHLAAECDRFEFTLTGGDAE